MTYFGYDHGEDELMEREDTAARRRRLPRVWPWILAAILVVGFFNGYGPVYGADTASWYSRESVIKEGNSGVTASGERFNDNALTCALPHHRFGKFYKVTNLNNGKSVIVRHNDFGPGNKPRQRGVVIDLSKSAFSSIADLKDGITPIKMEVLQ